MTLKVAIVGCGKIADGHVEEIQKMPDLATVVGVCDRELLMAEQLATRYGLPAHYDDLDKMLERLRPDVLHVTTPPQSHLALTRAGIDAGCHVYVEKPLTLTSAESQDLVSYAERHDKKLTVGYTYLFDPPALAMRALIEAGEIGDPVHVETFYGYNLNGQFGSAIMSDPAHWVHRLPGKLFQNNIDHALNKVTEFIEDDAPDIAAFGYRLRDIRYGDDRDNMLDELRWTMRGKKVSAYGTFSANTQPAAHFARVYGTKNSLHVDYLARTCTLQSTASLPSAFGRLVPAFANAAQLAKEGARNLRRFAASDFHFFAGLNYLIRAYYESLLGNGPLPISHRDILRIAAWLDEIFAQVPQDKDPDGDRS